VDLPRARSPEQKLPVYFYACRSFDSASSALSAENTASVCSFRPSEPTPQAAPSAARRATFRKELRHDAVLADHAISDLPTPIASGQRGSVPYFVLYLAIQTVPHAQVIGYKSTVQNALYSTAKSSVRIVTASTKYSVFALCFSQKAEPPDVIRIKIRQAHQHCAREQARSSQARGKERQNRFTAIFISAQCAICTVSNAHISTVMSASNGKRGNPSTHSGTLPLFSTNLCEMHQTKCFSTHHSGRNFPIHMFLLVSFPLDSYM
jgi:hypothetical protein